MCSLIFHLLHSVLPSWKTGIASSIMSFLCQFSAILYWVFMGRRVWGFDVLKMVSESDGKLNSVEISPKGWIVAIVSLTFLLFTIVLSIIRSRDDRDNITEEKLKLLRDKDKSKIQT
eukprot:TRINITY_DN8417_c0_g1_i2.p1 TRINITY_DN8417_c0_g1~~TRINITY_DN8417_c0_g1_i2.p1  ORF type:complete len:117 (-),score=6.38 TRINITY_DN8417_c0_g1_i2:91-441(-)